MSQELYPNLDAIDRPGPSPNLDPLDLDLFRRVDAGIDRVAVKAEYDSNNRQMPQIPGDNIYAALALFQQRATLDALEAHAELVERHTPLAKHVAKRYVFYRERLEIDDLEQEAWVALSYGLWHFDVDRGNKPSTFLYKVLSNRLSVIVAANDFPIKLSMTYLKLGECEGRDADDELQRMLASLDEEEDSSKTAGKGSETAVRASGRDVILRASQLSRRTLPFDVAEIDFDSTFDELAGEPKPPRSRAALDEARQIHEEMIEVVDYVHVYRDLARTALDAPTLRPVQKIVLAEYFGFNTGVGKTLTSIGYDIKRTRSRAGQIKDAGLLKARQHMEQAGIGLTAVPGEVYEYEPVVKEDWRPLQVRMTRLHAYGRLEALLEQSGSDAYLYALPRFARLLSVSGEVVDYKATASWVVRSQRVKVSEIPDLENPIVYSYIYGLLERVGVYLQAIDDYNDPSTAPTTPAEIVRHIVEIELQANTNRKAASRANGLRKPQPRLSIAMPASKSGQDAHRSLQPLYHAMGDFEQSLCSGSAKIQFAHRWIDEAYQAVFGYNIHPQPETPQLTPPDMRLVENQMKIRRWIQRRVSETRQ